MAMMDHDHAAMGHTMNTVAPSMGPTPAMGPHQPTGPPHHNAGTGAPAHGGAMMPHNMDMMKMYFHTGIEETVLFYQWKITTVGGMVGSCIGIFILAFLYEGLKVMREHLLKKYSLRARFSSYALPNGQSSQDSTTVMVDSPIRHRQRFCSWPHFLQTFLHVLQVFISYLLMLIFMTYNIWLCLAVVLGAGAGYLAFGWHKAIIVDVNEHCH